MLDRDECHLQIKQQGICGCVLLDVTDLHFNLFVYGIAGRNIDYMSLANGFTFDLVKAALIIEAFPLFLRTSRASHLLHAR